MQADEIKKIEELAKTDAQVKELYEKHSELKKINIGCVYKFIELN